MNERRLDTNFFSAPATILAPALLGKLLCRQIDGKIVRLRITETECYFGEEDTACHASKGKTPRTAVMYNEGGYAYVYLCYGIHYLFNIVTGTAGHPEAVLIRGVEGFDGPGKLTKELFIDKSLNGEDLRLSDSLWIEDSGTPPPNYTASKRVGIDFASPQDRDRLWRFTILL